MSLSYDEIAEILKIIDSSSCDEVIVETGEIRLVVRRGGGAGTAGPIISTPVLSKPTAAAVAKPADPKPPGARREAAVGQVAVTAPMVGTFYRASSPDAPPFVELDSIVERGQPICLIEVMKLFTTINADRAGRIVEIGAEDGELVEYGRTLFVIEPTE